MNILQLLVLVTMMSSAYAADEFGGVTFDSSVIKSQADAFKADYRYLYQNPVKEVDAEFLSIAELAAGDGPNMHNWLINRVKYIVGESFELNDKNISVIKFVFPSTPLAETPVKPVTTVTTDMKVSTVMSNLGSALYMVGKRNGTAFGLNLGFFNKLYAMSPRVGILQVGEGLFLEKYVLNPDVLAPVNSISRLATMFHEARHSDSNGKTTSLMHAYCPTGHGYAGYAACENVGNGPYTVGALSERHMMKNCSTCNTAEKTGLAARVVDSFSRVLDTNKLEKISSIKSQITSAEMVVKTYQESLLPYVNFEPKRSELLVEVKKLERNIIALKAELVVAQNVPNGKAAFADATPEGDFSVISLKDSMKKMERSLR
jgi:hypothetical protein